MYGHITSTKVSKGELRKPGCQLLEEFDMFHLKAIIQLILCQRLKLEEGVVRRGTSIGMEMYGLRVHHGLQVSLMSGTFNCCKAELRESVGHLLTGVILMFQLMAISLISGVQK